MPITIAVRPIQTSHASGWGTCLGCEFPHPSAELTRFRACTRCALLQHMTQRRADAEFLRAARALGKV